MRSDEKFKFTRDIMVWGCIIYIDIRLSSMMLQKQLTKFKK